MNKTKSLSPKARVKSKGQIMRGPVDFLEEFELHPRVKWRYPFIHSTNFIEHMLCARHCSRLWEHRNLKTKEKKQTKESLPSQGFWAT